MGRLIIILKRYKMIKIEQIQQWDSTRILISDDLQFHLTLYNIRFKTNIKEKFSSISSTKTLSKVLLSGEDT